VGFGGLRPNGLLVHPRSRAPYERYRRFRSLFECGCYAAAINPRIIAATVTLATFMELLGTAIANVALPHIGRVRPAAIATTSKLFGVRRMSWSDSNPSGD
jgi:hypothetical protein